MNEEPDSRERKDSERQRIRLLLDDETTGRCNLPNDMFIVEGSVPDDPILKSPTPRSVMLVFG